MAEFRKSPFVDSDLLAIWEYIAQDNQEAAGRVVKAAYSTFENLARNPGMGRVRNFGFGLRSFSIEGYSSYLIFYREAEWGIEIARVLHGARNLEGFFEGNDPRTDQG